MGPKPQVFPAPRRQLFAHDEEATLVAAPKNPPAPAPSGPTLPLLIGASPEPFPARMLPPEVNSIDLGATLSLPPPQQHFAGAPASVAAPQVTPPVVPLVQQGPFAAVSEPPPPVVQAPVPVVQAPVPVVQAPVPEVALAVSRFPSTITIRVPKVRRDHAIAAGSVLGTLAVVGLLFLVMTPREQRPRGDPLVSDKSEPTATASAAPTVAVPQAPSAPAAPPSAVASAPPPTTASAAPPTVLIGALPPAQQPGPRPLPVPVVPPPTVPAATEEKPTPPSGVASGTITVMCKPACDAVFVRTRNLGPSPIVGQALPVGDHPVTLKRSGSPNKQTVVHIEEGKNSAIRMDM